MNTYWDVQKIDKLDRLVIPPELLDRVGLRAGSTFEILVDEDSIVVQKYSFVCTLCDSESQGMIRFRERNLCTTCREQLLQEYHTVVATEE